jgi:hypothetical protein
MDRREFIKRAGVGSAALASLPVAAQGLMTPAWANDARKGDTNFRFVVVSKLTTGPDLVATNANGRFGKWGIRARGAFTHWVPEGDPPFPIVATGFFHATELISFDPIGMYGVLQAGTLTFEAVANIVAPERAKVPATITVHCNIAPGDLFTGHHEGVTIEGKDFTFEPLDPELGLTIFVPVPNN